ncbi:MAG: hypothetical protein ACYCOU_26820 [Sulfobacillus sp.]
MESEIRIAYLHSLGIKPAQVERLEASCRDGWQAAELLGVDQDQIADFTLFWMSHRPFGVLHNPDRAPRLRRMQQWFGRLVRPMSPQDIAVVCHSPSARLPWNSGDYQFPILMDRHLLDVALVWFSLGDNQHWMALTPENLLWVTASYVVDVSDGHWITDSAAALDPDRS